MPPLTPEQLQEIPVRLGKLTQDFEDSVLEDISRRIAKAGSVTDTAEWQLIRLKETGYANDFLENQIAEYTRLSEQEIRQVFFEAAQSSDEFYSEVYQKAGKGFVPLAENEYVQQLISAGIEQTSGELKNFTGSMGFSLPSPSGKTAFKERHLVECFFNKIKAFRRVATRYDKLATSFLAFVHVASIWLLSK